MKKVKKVILTALTLLMTVVLVSCINPRNKDKIEWKETSSIKIVDVLSNLDQKLVKLGTTYNLNFNFTETRDTNISKRSIKAGINLRPTIDKSMFYIKTENIELEEKN